MLLTCLCVSSYHHCLNFLICSILPPLSISSRDLTITFRRNVIAAEDLVLRDLYRCSGNFLPVHSSEHHPQYLRWHSSYEKISVDCSSLSNNHSDATCSRIHERKAPDIRKEFANTSTVVETNYNYVDSPFIFQG